MWKKQYELQRVMEDLWSLEILLHRLTYKIRKQYMCSFGYLSIIIDESITSIIYLYSVNPIYEGGALGAPLLLYFSCNYPPKHWPKVRSLSNLSYAVILWRKYIIGNNSHTSIRLRPSMIFWVRGIRTDQPLPCP